MSELNVIASGSSGNCAFINFRDKIIFIDIGVSLKKLTSIIPKDILLKKSLYLFITHEHQDHISSLIPFTEKFNATVLTSEGTADALKNKGIDVKNYYVLKKDVLYNIDNFKVAAFKLLHDSAEPFGYKFFLGEGSTTFATDFGTFSHYFLDYLNDTDILVLESNYEDTMLFGGTYHKVLKRRIASIKGHLSNKEAINIISRLNTSKIKKIFLGHVSEENNNYDLLNKYAEFCTKYFEVDTSYLKQNEPRLNIEL